ncbi:hypothetical protein [Pseudonocardia alaniniphila]
MVIIVWGLAVASAAAARPRLVIMMERLWWAGVGARCCGGLARMKPTE